MTREIKFRGKRKDNGEWIIGDIIFMNKKPFIYLDKTQITFIGKFIAVIPESVGQFTGLQDRNGKNIYEGDIIQDGAGLILVVVFCKGGYVSCYDNSCNTICGGIDETDLVIGNMFQNKDLLK